MTCRSPIPVTGFGWTAPFVQVFSLSYKPWHVIAALPNEQTIQTPLQQLDLASDKMQGSLVMTPGLRLALDRTTVVGDALRLTSSLGWTAGADTLRFATRQAQPGGLVHEVGTELLGLVPDPAVSAALPDLPPRVERIRLDAQVELSSPLSLTAEADAPPPHPVRIDLREVLVTWGDLALFGKGSVTANAEGLAEGRIDLRLSNWRKAIPVAVALGLVTPEVAPTWENMFAVLAEQSASPDDLDLPLVFQRGRMSLGPLPLGPAPRMR
jgi:hypothetical protein